MPFATIAIREAPPYRRDAFAAGLTRLGYRIDLKPSRLCSPDDLLVMWNRREAYESMARAYEARGARVVVVENGYIAPPGKKTFAMALGHHLGAGSWRVGGPERFAAMGLELEPWRQRGEKIVVLAQRGIGERGVTQPPAWVAKTIEELRRRTKRPVELRRHPGLSKEDPRQAIAGAHACVTWASGAGIKALAQGVPVFYGLPTWIGAGAAWPLKCDLERPLMSDGVRQSMFEKLAWAQWSPEEIASGEALAWLLT